MVVLDIQQGVFETGLENLLPVTFSRNYNLVENYIAEAHKNRSSESGERGYNCECSGNCECCSNNR